MQIARAKETTLERADLTSQLFKVCNSGKGGKNVYNFLSFPFLAAIALMILSYDSLSASRS